MQTKNISVIAKSSTEPALLMTVTQLEALCFQAAISCSCSSLPRVPDSNNSLALPGPSICRLQHFSLSIILLISSLSLLCNLNFMVHHFDPGHKSSAFWLPLQLSYSHLTRKTPSQLKSLLLQCIYAQRADCSWRKIVSVLTIWLVFHDHKSQMGSQ